MRITLPSGKWRKRLKIKALPPFAELHKVRAGNYKMFGDKIIVHSKKADVVRSIFGYYLAGASLGKIVDMLHVKGVPSPSGNPKWGRAAVDKLLSNAKYIPIVGMETYMDAQFERDRRCNVDYDKVGHPRKTVRYQSPSLEIN